jgi:tetratricopeptide (TPR) repeat protein
MTRGFRVFLRALVTTLAIAWASGADAAQLSQAQKDEVKLHYQRATRAYDLQKYQEAIEEYQKAYEISGDPPMLYNIGQAYRLADQPGEAVRYYRRFLQRMPNARNREDVERKIADQEKLIEERRKAAAAVAPPPPPPVTKSPPIVEIKPPPPEPPPPPPPPPPVVPAEPPSHARTVVGWSLIAAGVIADGVAIYEGYRAKQKGDELTRASKNDEVFDPQVEEDGKNANIAAIALGIGGTAVAIAGAIVLITSGGSDDAGAAPAASTTARLRLRVTPWIGAGVFGGGARLQF